MSSAAKSKGKDKKAGKELKTPSKTSVVANGGSGLPASAYNPLLGTFHTLDASSTSAAQLIHVNGRFRNIDDSDDHSGGTPGSGADYDSASNNDSRSVESEEQNKEKLNGTGKAEVIPGADNEKREKIRQKNERKHQRQKERRAQELHERCSGYLMSRKLEALAQQLVAMGFSQERATMALILNEGRVEEAVAWLFEGGEDSDKHKHQNFDSGTNLKIDISDELAQISELESKFKCSKQEVERAIVTFEGDLEKAAVNLMSLKLDQPAAHPKPEENGDPPSFSNGKITIAATQSNVRLLQSKPSSVTLMPQRRDEKDFNYTKPPVTAGLIPKSVAKTMPPVTRVQPKLEWARPPQIATPTEKRWPVGGGSSPSVSYSLAPPLQVSPPPSKVESRYVTVGNEYKNLQPVSVREPVIMMQRPQSVNTKSTPMTGISSSPPGGAVSWYPTSSEMLKPNGLVAHIPSTRSPSPNNLASNQYYHPPQYPQQHQPFIPASSPLDNPATSRGNGSFSRIGAPPTLSAASSLGLFSGLGSACSSGSMSPVDWNASSSMPSCDYTNIDWSLDTTTFLPSKHNGGLWASLGPYSRNNGQMSNGHMSNGHMYESSSGTSAMGVNLAMRPTSSNGNGASLMGLQDGGAATAESSAASSREWTTPFEANDLFSLPRQFVSSPSL